jgi:glycerol kinase
MDKYILSLDQGTTSSRAIVFDRKGSSIATAQKEFTQYYPKPGWVEHDAQEIWSTQAGIALEALTRAGLQANQLAAIGITNQRETTIVWDRRTGKPVYYAIVWQDRRTADFCDQMKLSGHGKRIQQKTGLIIDAYFSATKINWILNNVEGTAELAKSGHLAFGTVDSWLIWNLSKGKMHLTDVSNASRTMLFNIHSMSWDKELLELFGIPESMMPEVRSSSEIFCTAMGLFPSQVPVAGIAGDQQAALFGQLCTTPGMVKNTYGTGCFMIMNTGNKIMFSENNLLTTVAWKINNSVEYAIEGSIFNAGAIVQWLRDGLGIIQKSDDIEKLAGKAEDNGGVYLVPAFTGLGAPHWDQHARGIMVGLTRGTTAAHIARAAIESIAFQTLEVLQCMEADSGITIKELRVDGGATVNNLLMQFQSDIIDARVVRPRITETTALGAAYFAGLAVGFWDNLSELEQQWQVDRTFIPQMSSGRIQELVHGWNRAVKTALAWSVDK